MELTVKIEGLKQLERKLGRGNLQRAAAAALRRFSEHVKTRAIPYPPEGSYNRPGPYPHRWYQRHFGPRWARIDGSVGGRNTSERLQQQWLSQSRGRWAAVVRNRASYSGYVMGEEQTHVHAGHGWKRIDEIAQKEAAVWHRIFEQEIRRVIR